MVLQLCIRYVLTVDIDAFAGCQLNSFQRTAPPQCFDEMNQVCVFDVDYEECFNFTLFVMAATAAARRNRFSRLPCFNVGNFSIMVLQI